MGHSDPEDSALRNLWDTWFLGVQMIQQAIDVGYGWERVFRERDQQGAPFRTVIELGSGRGGLALYLALACYQRGATFWTLDHMVTDAAYTPVGQLLNLQAQCLTGDMWSPQMQAHLDAILDDPANHPLLLFCDGGNKPREMQAFGPRLHPGDMLAVHDWSTEATQPDLDAAPQLLVRLQMWRAAECDQLRLFTRWWDVSA